MERLEECDFQDRKIIIFYHPLKVEVTPMKYNNFKKYLFEQVSNRIMQSKEEKQLTYYQIAGFENKAKHDLKEPIKNGFSYDLSMIKSIFNGKAHDRKNPYLISDTYRDRIFDCLGLDNISLFWGDINFIDYHEIFRQICHDMIGEYHGGNAQDIHRKLISVLIDYVPYARNLTYYEVFVIDKYDGYKIPAYFYNLREDDIMDSYDIFESEAIEYLYHKCKSSFDKSLSKFIKEAGSSFSKLDKKIHSFVLKEMDMILDEHVLDENSLGLRVRNIVLSDYKRLGAIVQKNMALGKNVSDDLTKDDSALSLLIESSKVYIMQLAGAQALMSLNHEDEVYHPVYDDGELKNPKLNN